jgi:predicted PurR-regulated permease PerM
VNRLAPRKDVTRHLLVAIGLVALAAVLWTTAQALVIAFGGVVLASVLLSLSTPLSRATGLPARWSLLVVVLVLAGIAVAFGWLFGNEVATQFSELQRKLPEAAAKFRDWLDGSPAGQALVRSAQRFGANSDALSKAGSVVSGVVGAAGNLLLIVFLAIYFAHAPTLYRNGAVRLVPVSRRAQVGRALDEAGVALRKWLVAQVIAMVAVGVLTGGALALMGVPLALLLGVLAGLLEFVPVIGPIVSAVPGVLLAFSKGPEMAVYVALVYTAVQQVESNVITPLVQRWAVKLPPVIGLLSILVCGLLFGVIGVVFAMPIAVVTMVMVRRLYVEDTLERKG